MDVAITSKADSQLDGLKRLLVVLDVDSIGTELQTASDSPGCAKVVAKATRNVLSYITQSAQQDEEHENELRARDKVWQDIEQVRSQCAYLNDQAARAQEAASATAIRISRLEARRAVLRAEHGQLESEGAQAVCEEAAVALGTKMESFSKASTLCLKLEGAATLCSETLQKLLVLDLQTSRQLRDLRDQAVNRSQTLHEFRCEYWQLANAHQFRNLCAADGAILEDLSDEFLQAAEDIDGQILSLQKQLDPLNYAYLSAFCAKLEVNVLGHLSLGDMMRFAATSKALQSSVERMVPMACQSFVFYTPKPLPPVQGLPSSLIRNDPQTRSSRRQHPTVDLNTRLLSLLGCTMLRPHFQHLDLSAVPAAILSRLDVQQAITSLPSLVSVAYPASGWGDPTELRVFKAYLEGKGVAYREAH